jgi:hypothetical protein
VTKDVAEKLAQILYHTVLDGAHHPAVVETRLNMAVMRANNVFRPPPNVEERGGYTLTLDERRLRYSLDKCPIVVVDPEGFRPL